MVTFMQMPKVAILGTGLMGTAAAYRLSSMGYSITLWNRTWDKAERLAREIKARAVKDLASAIGEVDYAISFLLDDDAFLSVVSRMPRADGLILVNSSTITPMASKAAWARLQGLGICYVEAPVIGNPSRLRNGEAFAITAGEEHCIRRSMPLLRDLFIHTIHAGDIGAGMALKLSYNLLHMGSILLLAESRMLAESYGVEDEVFRELIENTVFRMLSERYLDRVKGGGALSARLEVAAKDLTYASIAGWDKRLPLPLTGTASQVYRLALSAGCGDIDYARTIDILRMCR